MSYATYQEYLQSEQFRWCVSLVIERCDGVCEDCKSELGVDPHHVRYCKWGEYDPPENLVYLCRKCHEERHRCELCKRVALKAKHIKQGVKVCEACNA